MNKMNGKTRRRSRILRIGIAAEAAGIGILLFFSANMQTGEERETFSDSVSIGEGELGVLQTEGQLEGELSSGLLLYGETAEAGRDYITWVDFNVTADAMRCALQYDLDTYGSENHVDWIVLLAYAGCRGGGSFNAKSLSYIRDLAERMKNSETTVEKLSNELSYFDYYYEAYSAVLSGYVGEYEIERQQEDGSTVTERVYGVKVFSPIAKGFGYSDYDDFGASRSYGYRRPHLGHDMLGVIGTPIVAVESGYVEAIGWNRYGGWRIGIRSFDKKRYYYYAHLRQNFPYSKSLKEGGTVTAGDVIGYMGHTGYSDKENVNNIDIIHLHFGLQLIFDESQKDGNSEIWISCYELARFLSQNRSETVKDEATKEWHRTQEMVDPAVKKYEAAQRNGTSS